MLEDALRMNALALDRHGIEIVRNCTPCRPVTADRHKVLQIVVNLVSNAKKAVCAVGGAAEKRITLSLAEVTASDGGAVARIAVGDSGVGIAAADLPKIFTHGYTTRADGHGFGLHFSAIAAKQMKGSLSVDSEGPGKGATFVLEIPLETPESNPTEKVEAETKCQA
jgi:signal transduction histidine kinase